MTQLSDRHRKGNWLDNDKQDKRQGNRQAP